MCSTVFYFQERLQRWRAKFYQHRILLLVGMITAHKKICMIKFSWHYMVSFEQIEGIQLKLCWSSRKQRPYANWILSYNDVTLPWLYSTVNIYTPHQTIFSTLPKLLLYFREGIFYLLCKNIHWRNQCWLLLHQTWSNCHENNCTLAWGTNNKKF